MLQTLAMFRLNRSSLRLEPTRPFGGFQEKEMHWNHRVMNCPSENGGDDYITFKEVFYEDGVPTSYSDPFIGADTKQGLEELVARLNKALEQPMLHEKNFN